MKTVVMIHGLNCTPKIFTYLETQLPKHQTILIDYLSSQPLEDSYEEILYLLPKNKPLSIIGHSLGGILGHLLATRNNEIILETLISISTPFGGSETAGHLKWFFPGFKILKDLSPRSPIIQEVSTNPIRNSRFVSVISTSGHLPIISHINDGVVSIRSQEATTSDEIVYIDSNHFEIMQDSHTINVVKEVVFPGQ